jgi:hypothetical protein
LRSRGGDNSHRLPQLAGGAAWTYCNGEPDSQSQTLDRPSSFGLRTGSYANSCRNRLGT